MNYNSIDTPWLLETIVLQAKGDFQEFQYRQDGMWLNLYIKRLFFGLHQLAEDLIQYDPARFSDIHMRTAADRSHVWTKGGKLDRVMIRRPRYSDWECMWYDPTLAKHRGIWCNKNLCIADEHLADYGFIIND